MRLATWSLLSSRARIRSRPWVRPEKDNASRSRDVISLPKYKLIQFPEYLRLRSNTLRHTRFPALCTVQIRHDALHIPRKIHLPCIQAIVSCCWRWLVPFSVFKFLINSLRVQAKREQVLQKRNKYPTKGTSYLNLSQKSGVALRVWVAD